MSTLKTVTILHPSSAVNNIVNDASGNVAVGGTVGMASSFKRNILINGNFLINQRVYVSGTATASGTYMHDRWKSTTTSSNYTFTQGTPDTTITIAAGTIAQIVENVNVAGGVYTLSWTGTATARIAINGASTSGSYAASPITTSSATAGQQITVEFSTGTCGLVQLEPGTKATTYERQIYSDQLAQCQRYYEQLSTTGGFNAIGGAGVFTTTTQFRPYVTYQTKRANPTFTSSAATTFVAVCPAGNLAGSAISLGSANISAAWLNLTVSGATAGQAGFTADNNTAAYLAFSSEL